MWGIKDRALCWTKNLLQPLNRDRLHVVQVCLWSFIFWQLRLSGVTLCLQTELDTLDVTKSLFYLCLWGCLASFAVTLIIFTYYFLSWFYFDIFLVSFSFSFWFYVSFNHFMFSSHFKPCCWYFVSSVWFFIEEIRCNIKLGLWPLPSKTFSNSSVRQNYSTLF